MGGITARVLAVAALVLGFSLLADLTPLSTGVVELGVVGLVAGATSIFLSFRVSEAYERWWEARKLWGRLVNASRDFARQVLATLDGVATAEQQRVLIRRQLAYVHALRGHLLPAGVADDSLLRRYLPEDEWPDLQDRANVPAAILIAQARELRAIVPRTTEAHILYARLDEVLTELLTVQGACERIRNTVFPYTVTALSRLSAWLMAVLVPAVVLESPSQSSLFELAILAIVGAGFVLVERTADELKTPFDGGPASMPMRALCRTIEIDLLESLGERDVPEPVSPTGGVLD